MHNESIVCFAKDWSEDPTSNNHVMRLLARDNRVLWLNSIATRAPKLSSGRDLKKIRDKLVGFARGPVAIEGGLEVYTPIVLPLPHSPVAAMLNERLLRGSVGVLRRKRGMAPFQLWSFIPTAAPYFGKMGESLRVYYCTDEWSHFSYVDKDRIVAMEKDLCERADIVFCTARSLVETKKVYNPETHLASHGVDQVHFAKALAEATPVAEELRSLKGPVFGFVGLIQDWVDLELLEQLATRRKDGHVVLVGKPLVDTTRLSRLGNVHLLGRKPYETLPSYLKRFDVALIPFVENELTRNVNPIKLREYLSAGLPVVSSWLPEVAPYAGQDCAVVRSREEFLAAADRFVAQSSPEARARRSQEMMKETWEAKVRDLGRHLERVAAEKKRPGRHAS